MKHQDIYDLCRTHMHSYVLAELEDGSSFDGIVTGLDEENVYFAVPIDSENTSKMMPYDERQFGWYGYGYPGFGYPEYGYHGYPTGPRRRFNRFVLPLAGVTGLNVLPWY